jgi:hypothetical protein
LRGKYAWEEVKLVRGGVVEFVMEFCPKVVAAVCFFIQDRALFLETEVRKCVMRLCVGVEGVRMRYVQSMGGDVGIIVGCGRWGWWMFGRGY